MPAAGQESPAQAPHACAACQKYKRRCDKALPHCSLCLRLNRQCKYSGRMTESALRARVQELEDVISRTARLESSASSSGGHTDASFSYTFDYHGCRPFQKFFLDSDFTIDRAQLPKLDVVIPSIILDHVDSHEKRSAILWLHFQTVHQWMPIISKVRLEAMVDQGCASESLPPDLALLILAMKLLQMKAQDSMAADGSLYAATKHFCSMLEAAGVQSMLKLQASLLITAFEIIHAVYPAAYVSVGYCVGQSLALGIHNKEAPQLLKSCRSWPEWEERTRVWWQVIAFDGFMASSGSNRPLLTEKPKMSSLLPADDEAWDRGGHIVPERLFLSSVDQLAASPFARLAQASHLLGEVIRHCNSDISQPRVVLDQLRLLYQALGSLLGALTGDDANVVRFQSAIAVCLSAVLNLVEHHNCDTYNTTRFASSDMGNMTVVREISAHSQQIMVGTVKQALSFIDILNLAVEAGNICLSPWVLRSVYQTAAVVAWLGPSDLSYDQGQHAAAKAKCVQLLRYANESYRVAGVYLEAFQDYEAGLQLE